jgi:O-antigen/teichoic acid export membrane protein
MSLVAALGAGFIIDLIAGSQGRGAIPVLRIQGLIFIVSFVSTSSALGLISIRRYRPLLIVSLSTLILNILLGVVLVPAFGARGGAVADVLTEAAAAVSLTFVLIRSVPQHQIRAALAGPVVLACAASTAVLLLPVGPLVQAIAATVVYFGVLLRTGTLPDELIDAARRLRVARTLP